MEMLNSKLYTYIILFNLEVTKSTKPLELEIERIC